MTETNLVADLQRAEVEGDLTRGALVAPSVVYLTDGLLGGLTLAPDAKCTLAAVALPFRICPEITLASLALNGALVNLSAGPSSTDAFTIIQFYRDGSWVIEISPYIRTDGMLVWDVEPKRYDDLASPEAIRELVDHLYYHIEQTNVRGSGWALDNLKDRFRVAGAILMEIGDATEVRITEGDKT